MSLPSESFDIQPHRLLAFKQSLQLEQQLNAEAQGQGEGLETPPRHQSPPQAPPLPAVSTVGVAGGGASGVKSLQQQLLAHRLQQKRQVSSIIVC